MKKKKKNVGSGGELFGVQRPWRLYGPSTAAASTGRSGFSAEPSGLVRWAEHSCAVRPAASVVVHWRINLSSPAPISLGRRPEWPTVARAAPSSVPASASGPSRLKWSSEGRSIERVSGEHIRITTPIPNSHSNLYCAPQLQLAEQWPQPTRFGSCARRDLEARLCCRRRRRPVG